MAQRGQMPVEEYSNQGIIGSMNARSASAITISGNRREFLKRIGVGVSGPLIVAGSTLGLSGAVAPSERIRLGAIGLGARGIAVMRGMMRNKKVRMVAVCDVDRLHHRDNAWGKGLAMGLDPTQAYVDQFYSKRDGGAASKVGTRAYSDYRELCAQSDLDAVIVATPDHWHAMIALEAVRNGKDVYCEKPVTHTFVEGQLLYKEVANYGCVFQTGSQQRSDWRFRRAVELVRNGALGKLQRVEVGLPAGYTKPMGSTDIVAPPEGLNYDFWCGPSPVLPYMRARHHRFWRGHLAFGGGNIMDWIGHHNDIAHWGLGLDESGPVRVEARHWTYPKSPVYNVPVEFEIDCDYANGVTGSIASKNRMGTTFIGESGAIFVDRGKLETPDARWAAEDFVPGPEKVYHSTDHLADFVAGVRARKNCVAPAETGHRSITPGHLGYLSNRLGRAVHWDPLKEEVMNDRDANTLLRTDNYRRPWRLV